MCVCDQFSVSVRPFVVPSLLLASHFLDGWCVCVCVDCIIEALGNPQKERLKHEDTNISDWLKGTSLTPVLAPPTDHTPSLLHIYTRPG